MAAAMAAFTINDTITKAVASEMNIGQIILVRGAFAFVLIAALASWRGAVRPVRTLLIRPVGMRVIGEIGGTLTFLSAIAHMPLANAAAMPPPHRRPRRRAARRALAVPAAPAPPASGAAVAARFAPERGPASRRRASSINRRRGRAPTTLRRHSGRRVLGTTPTSLPTMLKLDHLVVVAPTLAEGVAHVRSCIDVEVPFGQRHAYMGSHNHLLQLVLQYLSPAERRAHRTGPTQKFRLPH